MLSRKKPAACLTEKYVVACWQQQLKTGRQLVTRDGEIITVIYPGRYNDDRGPDFCDAVISRGGKVLRGDIEVHTKASAWWAHRHHLDHRYNKVILHVVFQQDKECPVRQQNDGMAPTVALDRLTGAPGQRCVSPANAPARLPVPCRHLLKSLRGDAIGAILDKAGNARLLARAAEFQGDLRRTGADQLLYEGIMRALGYRKNAAPFLKLARLLPLSRLAETLPSGRSEAENLARLQALFLGTAGFLPSPSPSAGETSAPNDAWRRGLEKIWGSLQPLTAMPSEEWNLCKVRPNNLPARRLAGMSYLLLRHRRRGLLNALIETLEKTPLPECHLRLQRAVQVTSQEYRARWVNAGVPSKANFPALIGSQRAAEITVNVLLPFSVARGKSLSQRELVKKAFLIYGQHPRSGVNSVERHMRLQLGITSSTVNSARRQQGLLHLYRNYCTRGKCDRCLLRATGG